MFLTDLEIGERCQDTMFGMITPFTPHKVRILNNKNIPSYGCSSFGYDIRAAPIFKIQQEHLYPNRLKDNIIDIIDLNAHSEMKIFETIESESIIIPPKSFMLTKAIEYFRMPDDITGLVTTKSTLARVGLYCLTTFIEPGWEGELVLEFFNMSQHPIRFHANVGAAQVLFSKGNYPHTPYGNGKYQKQMGITEGKN